MRRTLSIAAAILLICASPAQAKGLITSVSLCGSGPCGPEVGGAAMRALTRDVLGAFGAAAALRRTPPPVSPYYHVALTGESGFADPDLFWVPASAVLCTDHGCLPLGPR